MMSVAIQDLEIWYQPKYGCRENSLKKKRLGVLAVYEFIVVEIYLVWYNDDMEWIKPSTMTIIELASGVAHAPDRILESAT